MSDLDIMIKEKMIKHISDVMMEYWTCEEIADKWLEIVGCECCPYYDRFRCVDEEQICDVTVMKRTINDVMKEMKKES